MKILPFLLLILLSVSIYGQQIQLFRTVYSPSEPNGGEKELKSFFKQELVYPEDALTNDVDGTVFIKYKVNSKGDVILKQVAETSAKEFIAESERVFDKIIWEKDSNRSDHNLGLEEIKITFKKKKYDKLVKKRGYHKLPLINEEVANDAKVYNLKSVSKKPNFNAELNLKDFIKENFEFPAVALQQGISGRVDVEFIIEPYGKASNVRIVKALGGGCNEETVRLVKLMKWEPAKLNGVPVRCISTYQLNFYNSGGSVR